MVTTKLSIADRVTMYRLIADAYPEEESAEYLQHRHALHSTVAAITARHDTAEVQVQLAPKPATAHVAVPPELRAQFLTTGIVNANQPGYTEPAGADPFALGAL